MTRKSYVLAGAIGLIAVNLRAENAVLLESFEDGIGAVGPGKQPVEGIEFSLYAADGPGDPHVTAGSKSLQIDLTAPEMWVRDFSVTLSDEAAEALRAAAGSGERARYILRHDLVFGGGTVWMNSQVFLGTTVGQLDSSGRIESGHEKQTMSVALDLVDGIPESGPVVIRFAINFDAIAEPFVGPLTVHLDNIRIVDMHAGERTPVTTLLQSFEADGSFPEAVYEFRWEGIDRVRFDRHRKESETDRRVTEGDHSLTVEYAGAGRWQADFAIPFAGTKLARVLKLDRPLAERPAPKDLERYTLRFDVIFPDRDAGWTEEWMVMSFHTLSEQLPYSLVRRDVHEGEAQTMSITLDQLQWLDSAEGAPALVVMAYGAWGAQGAVAHFDNFRLIDTAPQGALARIAFVTYEPQRSEVGLVWESDAQSVYAIEFTEDFESWRVLGDEISGEAATTARDIPVPGKSRGFLRVRVSE